MEVLAKSAGGYIHYAKICAEMEQVALAPMIKYNGIHFCPIVACPVQILIHP